MVLLPDCDAVQSGGSFSKAASGGGCQNENSFPGVFRRLRSQVTPLVIADYKFY